ncbi:MAG: fluoride efflux transporter CrcB [Pseudomonadota bacterium]
MLYLGIVLAGGIGALLRYALGRLAVNLQWTALPFGTLVANLVGCFLIGYLSWVLVHRFQASETLQIVVITGFLGGFTTFSAFSLEAISMFESGANLRAVTYIVLQVVLCIVMCLLGLLLARQS